MALSLVNNLTINFLKFGLYMSYILISKSIEEVLKGSKEITAAIPLARIYPWQTTLSILYIEVLGSDLFVRP